MASPLERAVTRIQHDVEAFFRSADVNRSGKLSRTEFRLALSRPEFQLSKEDIDTLVALFDINDDYVIDMHEMRTTLERFCAEQTDCMSQEAGTPVERTVCRMRKDPRAFFQEADLNGSGKLNRQELCAALTKNDLGLSSADIQTILDGLELNVDKVLDINGFICALEKFNKPRK